MRYKYKKHKKSVGTGRFRTLALVFVEPTHTQALRHVAIERRDEKKTNLKSTLLDTGRQKAGSQFFSSILIRIITI